MKLINVHYVFSIKVVRCEKMNQIPNTKELKEYASFCDDHQKSLVKCSERTTCEECIYQWMWMNYEHNHIIEKGKPLPLGWKL